MSPGLDRRQFLRTSGLAAGAALAGPLLARIAAADAPSRILEPVLRQISTTAPPIVTRAQWGADESLRRDHPRFDPIRKFVIHHTDTPNGEADPAARMRSIYRSHLARHTDGDPWDDIGYNFVVDPQGRVYEGRWARNYRVGEVHDAEDPYARGVRGAHAENANAGTVGIALMGTFTGARPTDAAIDAVVDLIVWKCSRHGLDPAGTEAYTRGDGLTVVLPNVVGHRDVKSTDCPGQGAYALLGEIRRRAAQRVQPPAPTGPDGYRVLHVDGSLSLLGGASSNGDLTTVGVREGQATALAPGPGGYYVLDAVGSLFAFGPSFHGSVIGLVRSGRALDRSTTVDLAPTPTGNGYWVLSEGGGVYAFGDAPFLGSVSGLRNQGRALDRSTTVSIAPTASGRGYWVLTEGGGVYSFGDAVYHGSVSGLRDQGRALDLTPLVDLVPTASSRGYWVLTAAGGVYAFGDAPFFGSVAGIVAAGFDGADARVLAPTASQKGYAILLDDGAVMTFGDARSHGYPRHVTAVGLMPTQ